MNAFHSPRLLGSALVAGVLAWSSPLAAETEEPSYRPEVVDFTLDNGLEVVVIPDRRAPVVTHMLWYRVGSADEDFGRSGYAHFVEHLLFKATETYEAGEFSRQVAEVGGRENAFTSYDYTGYFQQVAPDRLAAMMRFEADRMVNLALTDEVVLPELQVVRSRESGVQRNYDNDSRARQMLGRSDHMHGCHYRAINPNYGRPEIRGWMHE